MIPRMAKPPSDPAGRYRKQSQSIGTIAVVVFAAVSICLIVVGLPVAIAGIIGAIVAAIVVSRVAPKKLG